MPNLLRLFFFFVTLPALSQPIVYVTQSGAGNASGTSWTNALSGTLLAGRVATASPGTQFWVAAGIYKPTTTLDRAASFSIASGVSVYGGFFGSERTLSERTPYADLTFLSGDIGSIGYAGDNSTHVVNLTNSAQPIAIDGLTIYGGHRSPVDYGSLGAGLFAEADGNQLSIVITNCRFDSNIVEGSLAGGGAIGIVSKNNGQCIFQINRCFFASNVAESGGALSSITQNGTTKVNLNDCLFADNSGTFGGAVYMDQGTSLSDSLIINRCQFLSNKSSLLGGAISCGLGRCSVNRSIFKLNSTNGIGGAIGMGSSQATYNDCLFVSNTASKGGVVASNSYSKEANQTFTNCTFSNNSASVSGGVFYNLMADESVTFANKLNPNYTRLQNCIAWNNSAPDSPLFKTQRIRLSVGAEVRNYLYADYSDLQDLAALWNPGTGNISVDPRFVDIANGNFKLQPNSPAINAGDPNTVSLPLFDLAGQVRIQNGRVDMGAYEFGCIPTTCQPVSAQRIR